MELGWVLEEQCMQILFRCPQSGQRCMFTTCISSPYQNAEELVEVHLMVYIGTEVIYSNEAKTSRTSGSEKLTMGG